MHLLYSLVLSMSVSWMATDAYFPVVFDADGNCEKVLTTVFMNVHGKNGPYPPSDFQKPFDLCLVPRRGPITGSDLLWGVATYGAAAKIPEANRLTVTGRMTRQECERLTDVPYLTEDTEVDCKLDLVSQDGTNANVTPLTDIMLLAGTGECPVKAASVWLDFVAFDAKVCRILKGTPKDNKCQFDLCYPKASQCVPSDGWTPIQVCINEASIAIKCIVSFQEGMSNTQGSTNELGGSVGLSYQAEVSADIAGLFSATVTTSASAEFSWANARNDESTWSKTTTHTMEIPVPSKKTIRIEQLVGSCGDVRVKTRNLRAIEPTGEAKRIVTRDYPTL